MLIAPAAADAPAAARLTLSLPVRLCEHHRRAGVLEILAMSGLDGVEAALGHLALPDVAWEQAEIEVRPLPPPAARSR